jgi:hypothetical protein
MQDDHRDSDSPVMTLPGTVTNGVVVLNGGATVPDGTQVQVLVPVDPKSAASPLGRVLLKYAGRAQGLPADMAAQHDHYLHGTPKRGRPSSPTPSISWRYSSRTTRPTHGLLSSAGGLQGRPS